MLIDTHVRPALYEPICRDPDRFQRRCDEMNYHKMKPASIELLRKQYSLADMSHAVLIPEDCSVKSGMVEISNDEIQQLVSCAPDFFIGLASVDPRREDATDELERAFDELGLAGLALNTARLGMYPTDSRVVRLVEICREFSKPVVFHVGFCLETNSIAKYAHPMEFEELISNYPDVRFCLAHFGWPWVQETAALLLKYANAYANTALMSFDGPHQLFSRVFERDMDITWVENNIATKVMFGSDTPRVRPVRSLRGLDEVPFSQRTRDLVYWKNAVEFFDLREG